MDLSKLPDTQFRSVVRGVLRKSDKHLSRGNDVEKQLQVKIHFIEKLRKSAIAVETEAANAQHYEVPTEFFDLVLGPRKKYSACVWGRGVSSLTQAEEDTLMMYCERAGLENGMDVLDFGCGWGSLSLFIAEKFPRCNVLALSNSKTQISYINSQGLRNCCAEVHDARNFQTQKRFDRIFSIEMLEHLKNYDEVFRRLASWLNPRGKVYVQVLACKDYAYEFKSGTGQGAMSWMADNFFSGGTMPSDDLFLYFQKDLSVVKHWRENGKHYERTLNTWLENLDRKKSEVLRLLGSKQTQMWRMFFMYCAETWGYEKGRRWIVTHYLFEAFPRDARL